MSDALRRIPVSIVCVSNNPVVLNDCLIRSVDAHRPTAPRTELIVVQNSQKQFSSAGAALNHGVSLAHNEVCVFVHQDVYLHSLVRLEEAAAALVTDTGIGLLGAQGITASGELCQRVRDRVVLTGRAIDGFAEVDSLDEFLIMARRDQLLATPLSEDPNLAWHAYAVEYGARMKHLGKRVLAAPIPLTHNSLTTNLDRLKEAHSHVGLLYSEQLPINTTCGIIDGAPARQRKFLASQRWRYRWLRGIRQAYSGRRALGVLPVVLSDIRLDVDDLLEDCGEERLTVVSLESAPNPDADLAEAIELGRLGRTFAFRVANSQTLLDWVSSCGEAESFLLTNLDSAFLRELRAVRRDTAWLLGFTQSLGFWLVTGPAAKASPVAWRLPSAKPLGLRTAHGAARDSIQAKRAMRSRPSRPAPDLPRPV